MIGTTVAHYHIESEIGRGGMGVVYKATDSRLGRTVALKFLPAGLHTDETAQSRFMHEAKTISALDHPNVAVVHEIREMDDGSQFIVMGYYEGDTLEDLIAEGPLDINRVIDYTRQIASGLQAAHDKGITHRDIKPGNVIVTASGLLKILDFGVAKVQDVNMTMTNQSIGTPLYMSPEQSRNDPVDHRIDLWALGVVMFEMLTATRPFDGGYPAAVLFAILNEAHVDVRTIRPGIPDWLVAVLDKLLAKNPDDRYPTAAAVVEALDAAGAGSGSSVDTAALTQAADTTAIGAAGATADTATGTATDTATGTATDTATGAATGPVNVPANQNNLVRIISGVTAVVVVVVVALVFGLGRTGGSGGASSGVGQTSGAGSTGNTTTSASKETPESSESATPGSARDRARARLQAGIAYLEKADYDLALAELEQAIAIDSTYAVAWSSLAAAYTQLRDYDAAVEAGRRALAIDPDNDGAYYNLGFALSGRDDIDEAIEAFENATKTNPGFTRAFSAWGDLLIEEGRPQEALDVLERGKSGTETNYRFLIYKNLGKAHIALDQFDEAVLQLESARRLRRDWPETLFLLATAYEEVDKTESAKELYTRYIELETDPELRREAQDRLEDL